MIFCECINKTTGEILQMEYHNKQNYTALQRAKLWYKYCRSYLLNYGDKYDMTVIRKDGNHTTIITKSGIINRKTIIEKNKRG